MTRTALFSAALVAFLLLAPSATPAQTCQTCWTQGCDPALRSYLPACKGAAKKPEPAPSVTKPGACPRGKVATLDTEGRCCWPGQVWADRRCAGTPTNCPHGFTADGDAEACRLDACPEGQVRMKDGVRCCWPGQGWSTGREACVGKPRCPQGLVAAGEGCAPEAALAEQQERVARARAGLADARARGERDLREAQSLRHCDKCLRSEREIERAEQVVFVDHLVKTDANAIGPPPHVLDAIRARAAAEIASAERRLAEEERALQQLGSARGR